MAQMHRSVTRRWLNRGLCALALVGLLVAVLPTGSAHVVQVGGCNPTQTWVDAWIDSGIIDPDPSYLPGSGPEWEPDDLLHILNSAGQAPHPGCFINADDGSG